jgi:hypothetical protein
MKHMLFEQKKLKLWDEKHFVKNKTENVQNVLKMQQVSFLPKS